MTTVCAVVVTHRRPDELAKSLDALSTQSRLVDQLIVVDNDADERVRDLVAGQPIPTTYLPSHRNLGGAGGFALGILHALALGADWVWPAVCPFRDAAIPRPRGLLGVGRCPLRIPERRTKGGPAMSATNKLRNKLQRVSGRAKETIGRATGDRNLESRGVGDQFKADVKAVGEKAKDVIRGRHGRRGRGI